MERLARWLVEHKPADSGGCLIHNDYKYDNLVLDPHDLSRIKACLDWEMATIGDPLMDLGSTLGYWVDPDDPEEWRRHSFGVTTLPGNLNREQLLQRYVQQSGHETGQAVFYYIYGLFKIAVIVQQIYARYRQGLTRDERFGGLIDIVRAASQTGCLALAKGRIAHLTG
jgi:aminoglycoside phosphotransferase (APT) family kinase protein